ncbi:transporter [Xanthomonas hyacinthi]|uniref:transporter n=1 Tax=Xanthomonas hyacinthi TaxID=56455 RepID=UPI001302FA6B|nr:transporter [Xanthomonas hyacinthi]
MPADYTVLPKGANLGLVYLQHAHSDEFRLDGAGKVPRSSLDTNLGILRVLHYSQIGAMPVAYQAFLPFGSLDNFKVGGARTDSNGGVGDLTLGFTMFFAAPADPGKGTTVGLTGYVVLPTAEYDLDKSGIGSGTYSFMPQLGVIHGFGNGWFFDGALDVSWQKDHRQRGVEVAVDPAWQAQAYLRRQLTAATSVSFGYSGMFGGKRYIGDVYAMQKTRGDTIKIFASHMFTPTFQINGMLGAQFDVEGGFKQRLVAQVRFMKLFF